MKNYVNFYFQGLKITLALLLSMFPTLSLSQSHKKDSAPPKNWTTYWNTAQIKPNDPLAIFPELQVPEFPEKYRWIVKNLDDSPSQTNNSVQDQVPIYRYDPSEEKFYKKGTIAVGTEITLDKVVGFNRILYYGFLNPNSKPSNQQYVSQDYDWISGLNIKISGFKDISDK